ncbi:hypothetical protein NL676_013019 [Syzygium grande]|nr:hypothetical protein NL676_013019 [Syzygium grande]
MRFCSIPSCVMRSIGGSDRTLSLLRFAWKSWTEENMAAFVDPVIYAPSDEIAILSEILDLPSPKQPAFTSTQADVYTQQDQKPCSVNNLTVTIVQP